MWLNYGLNVAFFDLRNIVAHFYQ